MKVWMFVAVMLGYVEMRSVDVQRENRTSIWKEVCYGSLGCFSNGPPFYSLPERPLSVVPESPDKILTKFLLYTRDNRDVPQVQDARYIEAATDVWTHFKKRKTQILIHGFLERIDVIPLYKEMKDQLLKHGDYNVVIVDWSGGNLPPATQATANTRVVGAQVAELIQSYTKRTNMTAADFHVIGQSLGAHIAGYAGERILGLGRITGLDPGGPYFENTDPRVRLDETDANFVDAIHTDAQNLLVLGLGTKTPSGHADFFPNLGHDQPGCGKTAISLTKFLEYGFGLEGVSEALICSHMRGVRLFTESINSRCPFLANPCASEEDFVNKLCNTCANKSCSYMGFHADKKPPPGNKPTKYYLTTGDREPFCRYHYGVTIKFSLGQGSEQEGDINLDIKGDVSTYNKVSLTGDGNSRTFKPGQRSRFYVMLASDVGNVQSVTFSWNRASPILDILNIFRDRNPKLYVDEIDIYREEAGIDAQFCAEGQSIVSGSSLNITKRC